ncbi:hypothetical protein [Kitasatospora phosalacinea]|uniref:Uncharacterized protein n=1 Tax=Kitasatospora phosalacinea TaxID=2065 RepID=A0A9W6PH39_9ACTN|nr:hypothetical protein [Kitasatospora phosalacinea]GLW54925.1 hypothetical protein Kpho01_29360 [Kitasatospora phosalacinea]
MTTSGNGFQVEVDNLRAFASQVRGLLSEFESGAGKSAVYGASGVGSGAFGSFGEAQELGAAYNRARVQLSGLLDQIQETIDVAQQNADHTAMNYEEHEQDTSKRMTMAQDGWTTTWSQSELNAQQASAKAPQSQPTTTARPQW